MANDKKVVRITFSFEAGISDEEDAIFDLCNIVNILKNATGLTGKEFNWIGKIDVKMEDLL